MRSLRTQLLFSHLLLVGLMVLVMAGAVANFVTLGGSIDRILKDNYKSVIAAQDMKEALERQDSAATFFLTGNAAEARTQYRAFDRAFQQAYDIEAHNITEAGEQAITDDIWAQYAAYSEQIDALLRSEPPTTKAQTDRYSQRYFATLKPAFLRLKKRVQDVLNLNEQAIIRASDHARREARRATVTALAATGSAFVLALFFAFRMIGASLRPLRSLARQAEAIGGGGWGQRIELERSDEIGMLAQSFNRMSEQLQEAWRLEEQRLHRAERMSDAALESLYDPVIVTDSRGVLVYWNRASEGLFGSEKQAVGLAAAQAIPDTRIVEAIEHAIHQERVSASEDEAGLVTLQTGNAPRTYRLRATPMRDEANGVLGAVVVLEDVTHVRELDRLKTEFIGVASHELRTPVTSLLLSVQLLQEGAVGDLSPEQQEVIAAQREDLERLERMMRDLLDVTRLEAGVIPPRLEVVPPHELIQAAVQSVVSQAEVRKIAIIEEAPDGLPFVRSDRTQIARVLINLLNNALRHTPEGGQITVRAFIAPDATSKYPAAAEYVAFQVQDTGAGIPPDYLARIFERFVQVPGATGGGAGLGLSIVQTIVRAHGGTITAASAPGEGSTFTFTLPIGRNDSERESREKASV